MHVLRHLAKTLLAGAFFSHFMKVWHQPIGPSKFHQVGFSRATPFTTAGFAP
jgi:hypothetical protein